MDLLGEVTYRRTYAKPGEDWPDTVARVVGGIHDILKQHCLENGRPWDPEKRALSSKKMYQHMLAMRWLPPGRGLDNLGTSQVQKSGAFLNNCGFVSTAQDPFDAFCWAMDMSMCGVGVGFDVLGSNHKVTPPFEYCKMHEVHDSREGWVDALRHLTNSYSAQNAPRVVFNFSKIRPAGAPIGTNGRTASGPEPLREMLEGVRAILDSRIGNDLGETAIVDIMNLIGKCVVAGNVRRSAEIALGSIHSEEFISLKDPTLHAEELKSHRWCSNNSVIAPTGSDYGPTARAIARNGEPGILWLDNARAYGRMGRRPNWNDHRVVGVNPCSEQSLEHKELCNLVETFPSRHESYYEFQETLKYAYLAAKAVSLVSTHCEESNQIIERNRRIGCSMSGIQEAITKFGHKEFYSWCSRGYKYIRALDDRYSEWLGVNRSIKITSVKPSGTVSLLPGVTPGIHFPVAEYYYRTIRLATDNAICKRLQQAGIRCVDLSPDEPNTTVAYFPKKVNHFSRGEKDVTIWEQAEHIAKMQHYWADNQVSATIKFRPHEAGQIEHLLNLYQDRLKSVSFLPYQEHGYEHAPYQPITREEYERAVSYLTEVDLSATVRDSEERFCDGEKCEIP